MKKIIDDRGRLFGLISVIDIFVIAVVAVLAVAVFFKNGSNNTPLTTVNTIPVTYTVVVSGVRDTAASLLRSGDKLYADSGIYVGTIKDCSMAPAESVTALLDGTYIKAPIDERYDVTLTVEAQCSVTGGRYYADRTFELNANSEQPLLTKYNKFKGVITEIMAG